MTANKMLKSALTAVDWNQNVNQFLDDDSLVEQLTKATMYLALWSRQLEDIEKGNPALGFIREMQASAQSVSVLIPLALYKPASASMRTVIETALYYTYFRSHPEELATLRRNKDYYITKDDVIEFHKNHSVRFKETQMKLGLLTRLNSLYKELSSIIHGQVPGVWSQQTAIKDTAHVAIIRSAVINSYCDSCNVVHRLFLCTIGQLLWDDFSSDVKQPLLSGLTGDEKLELKLDLK